LLPGFLYKNLLKTHDSSVGKNQSAAIASETEIKQCGCNLFCTEPYPCLLLHLKINVNSEGFLKVANCTLL
jgi:hypothetical protein